jgi:hypothetical protein
MEALMNPDSILETLADAGMWKTLFLSACAGLALAACLNWMMG